MDEQSLWAVGPCVPYDDELPYHLAASLTLEPSPLIEAVDGLEAEGRLSAASYNAAMLADSFSRLGRFDEAVEAVERARDLGERGGDPNSELDPESEPMFGDPPYSG